MKLSSHSVVAIRAIRAAALVLLLGAALPLAAQTAIGGVDTIPPTVPTGLVGTAVSANQIGLSWNPSTDNVGATGYRVYWGTASGVYLQARGAGLSTTTTTYTVTGLASPARYFFAVTAQNTLEESVYSNEIFVDVGISLESPSGKMLTQAGVDSIVDSVGAVWTLGPPDASGFPTKARNGVVDGSAAVLCYSGRSVNARGDLAGGWWKWTDDATLLLKGSWSSVSTTPIGCVVAPAADTTPPTVPTGLVAVAISPTQIRLTWNPSTDNVGVTGYLVYNADTGSVIATTTTTSFTHSGLVPGSLVPGTTHNYRVSAFDAVPNHSPWTDPPVSVTMLPPDTTAPSTPTEILVSAVSSSQINLSWAPSTDNVKVTRYIVRRDGVRVATPVSTSYADIGLSAATTYSYTVAARDAAGNISPYSTSVSVTTASAADTTAPSAPTGLTAAAAGSSGANLSWSASTDDVGVTGYIVRRNGVQVGTPVSTSYADAGLSAATTYSYTVAASDAAGNISSDSTSVSVTTAGAADTTPPTTPTGLTAAAGSSGANLSWSASTDNVGVTGYIVRRNGAQVATPVSTSYADTGLSIGTYSYTVAARDAAGNISPNSTSVSITIADTTPPSVPTGLTAAAAGSSGANLSWSASTDNVGVTGYIVRRNGVQIATPGSRSYADTGLSAATTYSYTVAARDAAGNTSPNSASVNVATLSAPPSNSADLAWDAVTGPNLSGYRVYFGTAPGTYLQPLGQGISVGNVTTYTMIGLASGTRYYFAVTDFDILGNESSYSNEVFKDIP